MDRRIATGTVEVRGELRELYRDMAKAKGLTEKTMKEIGAERAEPKIDLDLSALLRKKARLDAELDAIRKARAEAKADLDTAAFDARAAEIEAEKALLGRNIEIVVQAKEDGSLGVLRHDIADLNQRFEENQSTLRRWLTTISRIRVQAGFTSLSIRQFVVSLGTLGPVLVSVAGAATALAGSLGQALVGATAAGSGALAGFALSTVGVIGVVKPFITQLGQANNVLTLYNKAVLLYGKGSDQAKNYQDQLNSALANMSPPARAAFTAWRNLRESFAARTKGGQDIFLGDVNAAMKTARTLMPQFARQSVMTFRTASQGFREWLRTLRSGESQNIIGDLMRNFRRALPAIIHGFSDLTTAFLRFARAGSDFFPGLARDFAEWAHDLEHSTKDSKDLHSTVGGLIDQFRSWVGLLGATGSLLVTVLGGGAHAGQNLVDTLTRILDRWNAFLSTSRGQNQMHRFFSQSVGTTKLLGATLGRLLEIIFNLGRAMRPFADGLLAASKILGDVGQWVSSFKPLYNILRDIGIAAGAIWAINKITAWEGAAEAGLLKIGLITKTFGETAAASYAGMFAKGLRYAIPAAVAAEQIGRGVSTAISDDIGRGLGRISSAGLGGALGSFLGPVGTLIGAQLGGDLGDALIGKLEGTPAKIRDIFTRSAASGHRLAKSYREVQQGANAVNEASRRVQRAHHHERDSTDKLNAAEHHLARVKADYPAHSQPVVQATQRVVRLKKEEVHWTQRVEHAERLSRQERKAQIPILKDAVASGRADVRNKQQVAHATHQEFVEARHSGAAQSVVADKAKAWRKANSDLQNSQHKLNTILAKASQEISPKFAKRLDDMGLATLKYGRGAGRAERFTRSLGDTMDRTGGSDVAQLNAHFGQLSDTLVSTMNKGDRSRTLFGDTIPTALGKAGRQTDSYRGKTREMGNTFGDTTEKMKRDAGQDLGSINQSLAAQMKKFGLSAPGATVGHQKGGHVQGHQKGGPIRAQAGMQIPGIGDGDKYPLMLPPGSFILNREAASALAFASGGAVPVMAEPGERVFLPHEVAAFGQALPALNALIPRFASGGFAGMKPGITTLIKNIINRFGGTLSSGYRPGDTGSFHSQGLAGDWVGGDWQGATRYANSIGSKLLEGIHQAPPGTNVSWDSGHQVSPAFWGPSTWAQHRSHVHLAYNGSGKGLGGAGGSIHLPRFKALIRAARGTAGGLNKVSAAGEAWGNKRLGSMGADVAAGGQFSKQDLMRLWNTTGKNGDANLMAAIALAESGGNPSADNGIARGLWQIISGTWSAYGQGGWDNAFDPRKNATAAHRILAGGGLSQWDTYTSGAYRQFMQEGGLVDDGSGLYGFGTNAAKPSHHSGVPHFPRLPHHPPGRLHGRGTGPGSWYEWYGNAIEYFDQLSSLYEDKGQYDKAKGSKQHELRRITDKEQEIKKIIHRMKRHIHKLHGSFKFRKRRHGESPHDYNKAKRDARKQHQRETKQKASTIRQGLPALQQELKVDLPFQYQSVLQDLDQIGATDQYQQTAFGQERYDLLSQFGGNFIPLGGGILTPSAAPSFQLSSAPPKGSPMQMSAPSFSGGTGAAGGSTTKIVNQQVVNNYKYQPEDPHTWSKKTQYELGAVS